MKILVTAGPTREYLDPVRFISNPSTGKMGYAMARAARERGHRVVLVSGPTQILPPVRVKTIAVETSDEMFEAVRRWFHWCDGVVMAAAVGDFKPSRRAPQKIKKAGRKALHLTLTPTLDILAYLSKRKRNKWLVGFAAETDNWVANARKKLKSKNLDLILVNNVREPGAGFGSDTNRVTVLNGQGKTVRLPRRTKLQIARWLIGKIERDLQRNSNPHAGAI